MSKILKNINLWISILLFVLYAGISSYSDFTFGKSNHLKRLQTKISDIEKVFDNVSRENFIEFDKKILEKNGIGLLVFENDSLIFWSSNKFPEIIPDTLNFEKATISFNKTGIYFYKAIKRKNRILLSYYKLKNNYPFENEYLKNTFNSQLKMPEGVELLKAKTNYPLKNNSGETIAFLDFKPVPPSPVLSGLLVFILLLGFTFFLVFLFNLLNSTHLKPPVKRVIYYGFLIIGYFVFNYSALFSYLKSSVIFQPESFAYTSVFPSVMSFFSGIFLIFYVLIAEFIWNRHKRLKTGIFSSTIILSVLIVLFIISFLSVKIILQNSSADIDPSKIVNLNITGFFGLFSIVMILVNFLLAIVIVINLLKDSDFKKINIITSGLTVFIPAFFFGSNYLNIIGLLAIYILIILKLSGKTFTNAGFYISLAVLLSFLFNHNMTEINKQKEEKKREILIKTLALNQDPELEYLFGEIETRIYSDTTLINLIDRKWDDNQLISDYIINNYFSKNKHWSRYDFQITICDQNTNLLIKPTNINILCSDFFYNNLISRGHITSDRNLYRLEYGSGQINYLGLFRFKFNNGNIITVYVEINSKIKRKGFTKLLSPSGLDPFEKVRNYSVAKYEDGKLVENYGDFSYQYEFADSLKKKDMVFREFAGYNHLFYRINQREVFVLSRPVKNIFARIAPFSYLFVILIILTILFIVLFNRSLHFWNPPQSFSYRLQMSFVALLAFSLILIAIISTIYIKKLNQDKDARTLKNTAFSLQTEFEHKLANTINEGDEINEFLTDLSNKFSKVFNTDINLYDLDGNLLATTRYELFNYGLLSTKISPEAFVKLRRQKHTYFIFNESIGSLKYYSAYMPFHDADNRVVAYLNLPYFARQDQLRKEVASFVTTLMNVYTFMIVISILAILLLSNYIIRPLKMIKEKMRKIRVGKENEYIQWNRDDEIGELVEQYNRMVDELAESAEILAKSERESAWQQMARQVAHEIKNPLTPMKLSVQYLLKAIDDGADDVEERIKRLSNTLIEQIDTLAEIATAFSDFAKMPVSKKEKFDLKEAVDASIKIFLDYENVEINFNHQDKSYYVYADKQNLIRVFNNLIKNSIQSFEKTGNGKIEISIIDEPEKWKIIVGDNGIGIPDEEKAKIFDPNFTTKSSGMGLGLAMVKNIILNNGGTIDFESHKNKGTVFYIYLSKADYE